MLHFCAELIFKLKYLKYNSVGNCLAFLHLLIHSFKTDCRWTGLLSLRKAQLFLILTVEPWLPENLHYSSSVATTVQPLRGFTLKLCSELYLSYSAALTLPQSSLIHTLPLPLSPKDTDRNKSFTRHLFLLLVVILLLLYSSSLYNL